MILLWLCLIYFFTSGITAQRSEDLSNNIIELNDGNLVDVLQSSNYSLVYFYSHSCEFCHRFNPDFEYLSILYNKDLNFESKTDFQIVKTDAIANKRISKLFGISGYPTLKLVNYDTKEITTFGGKRNCDNIIEFIRQETGSAPEYDSFVSNIRYLHDERLVDILLEKKDTIVVFTTPYTDEWHQYERLNHFYQKLAIRNRDEFNVGLYDSMKIESNELLTKYNVSNFPSIIYFKTDGSFKIFNHIHESRTVNEINEETLSSFLLNLESDDNRFGTWFRNYSQYNTMMGSNESLEFRGINKEKVYGFNIREGSLQNHEVPLSLEQEYQNLLEQIRL